MHDKESGSEAKGSMKVKPIAQIRETVFRWKFHGNPALNQRFHVRYR